MGVVAQLLHIAILNMAFSREDLLNLEICMYKHHVQGNLIINKYISKSELYRTIDVQAPSIYIEGSFYKIRT